MAHKYILEQLASLVSSHLQKDYRVHIDTDNVCRLQKRHLKSDEILGEIHRTHSNGEMEQYLLGMLRALEIKQFDPDRKVS